MDEANLAIPKPKKSPKRFLRPLFLLFVAALAAVAGYVYHDWQAVDAQTATNQQIASLQSKIDDLNKQLDEAKKKSSNDSTICSPTRPDTTAVDTIKASVTSRNTQPLEGYMASTVRVLYAASDGVGNRTPTEAVSDVTGFLGDTTVSWSFDIASSTMSAYERGDYALYFPKTALAARSTTKKVISFNFDCSGKITTVFMSNDESLLK